MTTDPIQRRGDRAAVVRAFLVSLLIAALAAAALAVLGCGSNESSVQPRSRAEVLTENGWRSFAAGSALEAQEMFEDAVIADSAYADAENGLGWVHLFFGLFAEADEHFLRARDLGLANEEAEAGHAIAAEIEGDAAEALAASARVLAAQPRWTFSRRDGIDYRDLRLVRARSFFAQGDFLGAKSEVDLVNPSNTVNAGLPTFIPDLLAEIERLGDALYDS